MPSDRTTRLASRIVVGTGALWGLYRSPVRRLAEIALPGFCWRRSRCGVAMSWWAPILGSSLAGPESFDWLDAQRS